jgi:predicted RNA-binding protein with PUA-like domain
MKYWLLKSEPTSFSYDDLLNSPEKKTCWSGVRSDEVRDYLRDEIKEGDLVLFCHSEAEPSAIVGTARVVSEGYPDFTQFDPEDPHFDPSSDSEDPRWFMVDIQADKRLPKPLPIDQIKEVPALKEMLLVKDGARLSIQPVSPEEWEIITSLAGASLE